MKESNQVNRRDFIQKMVMGAAALSAGGILFAGCKKDGKTEVSPVEDLMGEHGVLERLLLIFDELSNAMAAGGHAPANAFRDAAGILRNFIENYHEKLEEEFLFPRFRTRNVRVDLVNVLQAQHDAGRRVMDGITASARLKGEVPDPRRTAERLRAFVRMFRSHMGWEDTVLFPAFRTIVSPSEYHELGERFEDREHEKFGEHGFADTVERVLAIERELHIHELARFTVAG